MIPLEIKAVRLELGFSQEQLADAVGVSRSTICEWEKRKDEGQTPLWFDLAVAAVMARLAPYQPAQEAVLRARRTRRIDKRWPRPLPNVAPPAHAVEGEPPSWA